MDTGLTVSSIYKFEKNSKDCNCAVFRAAGIDFKHPWKFVSRQNVISSSRDCVGEFSLIIFHDRVEKKKHPTSNTSRFFLSSFLNPLKRRTPTCKCASLLFPLDKNRLWLSCMRWWHISMLRRMTLTLCRSSMLAQFSSEKTTTVSEHCTQLGISSTIGHLWKWPGLIP